MKSQQMISHHTPSAISSQVSGDGSTRSAQQGGRTISKSGQGVARASHSHRQVSVKAKRTRDISGPSSLGLSSPADLQSCLESKLRARMGSAGSTLYRLIWKARTTPLGRQICARRASVLRISGSDCTSWPTPNAGPQNDTDSTWQERRARLKAKHKNGNGFGMTLGMCVQYSGINPDGSRKIALKLTGQARLTDIGGTRTGSGVPITSIGQLNPAHSRWLMGFPPEWDDCAVTAMPLSHRSRRSLSKPR
jgi:hypothetical protein